MFYFPWTRKPDFNNIDFDIYKEYWQATGYKMREKILPREEIFIKWIDQNSSVLSLGCGNSRLLFELKKQKNCRVIGADIETEVIKGLEKEGVRAKQIDLSKYDTVAGEFRQERFDYVVLSEVLEHFSLPEKLIKNAKQLSKKFIISIPNSAFYRYRLGLMFGGRFFTQWLKHPAEHLRFWSHIDFVDWLIAQDLEIIKIKSSNGPKILRDIWPNMFGHQICYLVTSK